MINICIDTIAIIVDIINIIKKQLLKLSDWLSEKL